MEDDPNGRQPKWKMTQMEDDPDGRPTQPQPNPNFKYLLFFLECGPAQPQLVKYQNVTLSVKKADIP